jgi:multidrug resistance efflux pump
LNYNIQTPEKSQVINIRSQIITSQNRLNNRKTELYIYESELENARIEFEAQKRLYGKDIITRQRYQEEQNRYASAKRNYEGLKSSIKSEESSLLALRSNLRQASIGDKTSFLSTDQNLEQAKQTLENQILQWEQQLVLKTPITGEVTVFDIWSQYQNVNVGQDLFTVIPDDIDGIIGRVTVPVNNSGKIKVGQSVLIKLDSYPYQEWGSLSGEIINISGVPQSSPQGGGGMYTVYLKVATLESSFEKPIEFKQEMEGTAEIVVEELTVMQRIFYQLREVFSRK